MPVLWSATGRAFAAFCPGPALDALIESELAAATEARRQQLPGREAVQALFAQIREQGCAPLRDVLLSGVSAVAAPIFDVDGKVPAVMTALGPSGSFDPAPERGTALLVRHAAAAVSARLGAGPRVRED